MTDNISRADAIKAIQNAYCKPCKERGDDYNEVRCRACEYDNAIIQIDALPSAEAEPKENHTQATGAKHVIKSLGTDSISHNGIDCTEFINWLLEEVMYDEMWELNAVANGEIICRKLKKLGLLDTKDGYYIRPSAEAVTIHEDGTLEVTVPNAHKVGRVLVMDAESHIGGGLFYPDDAVHGEWEHWGSPFSDESEVIDTIVCSVCGARFIEPKDEPKGEYNYCPNCGADMRGEEE